MQWSATVLQQLLLCYPVSWEARAVATLIGLFLSRVCGPSFLQSTQGNVSAHFIFQTLLQSRLAQTQDRPVSRVEI